MEVIVVKRKYDQWELSYSKNLGVCISDEKADELIEIDKHKDDHIKISKERWFSYRNTFYERVKNLLKYEESSPKKTGFLNRFNYDSLNKSAKNAYKELESKYVGRRFDDNLYYEMNNKDKFYLFQILVEDFRDISFEEYNEISNWFSSRNEDPEDISYYKEKFELIE